MAPARAVGHHPPSGDVLMGLLTAARRLAASCAPTRRRLEISGGFSGSSVGVGRLVRRWSGFSGSVVNRLGFGVQRRAQSVYAEAQDITPLLSRCRHAGERRTRRLPLEHPKTSRHGHEWPYLSGWRPAHCGSKRPGHDPAPHHRARRHGDAGEDPAMAQRTSYAGIEAVGLNDLPTDRR